MRYGATIKRLAGLTLRRPGLVPRLLGAAWRFRARDWYRRPPFLPLPPASYLGWRMYTAYGDEDAVPPLPQLTRFLDWSVRQRGR